MKPRPRPRLLLILLGALTSQSACRQELVMTTATCSDRHCVASSQGCATVAEGFDATPRGPRALCQLWSLRGENDYTARFCMPLWCGACPPGSTCDPTGTGAPLCIRHDEPVADRLACETDADCVPESCCRPTICVSSWVDDCQEEADESWCTTYDCKACISNCLCVNGCCVTQYDSDGCC